MYLNKSTKLIFIAVVIICLLFFLHVTRILSPLENLIVWATKPLLHSVYGASNYVNNVISDFKSKKSLIADNELLRAQLLTMQKDRSLYLTEKEENDFLRKQIDFIKKRNYNAIVANVIGKNVDESQNSLIIDAGVNQGLAVGLPVLSGDGVLIGKISQVNRNDAFVLLINDDMSKVTVKVQNADKTMGLAEGEYGLGVKMNLIPQTETVRENDLIVTSGLEKNVPAGLLVGEVESVQKAPEELFQAAVIRPLVDLNKITLVSVLKNSE